METIGHVSFVMVRFVVRTMLAFDRKVVKRFLNIETPLYKLWWRNHRESLQRKLDAARYIRDNETVFCNA